MTRNSLRSTTAILAAISLLQPGPALAQSNVNANANADAAAEEAEAQVETDAAAKAQAEDDAKVAAEARAEADAEAAAAEEAKAQAEADAAAKAQAEDDAKAAEEARAEADAEAAAAEEAEAQAEADAAAKEQQTESVVSDTSVIETLTGAPLDALATEADAGTPADVTTETVTEETSRASDEEFDEWSPEDQAAAAQQTAAPEAKSNNGMSDLQKAGLLALGAAVVGGILLNGQRVEANTGDRVIVVDDDNDYRILKDDDALLRQPGSDVRTQRFSDGSTRTNVMRGDGTEIVNGGVKPDQRAAQK